MMEKQKLRNLLIHNKVGSRKWFVFCLWYFTSVKNLFMTTSVFFSFFQKLRNILMQMKVGRKWLIFWYSSSFGTKLNQDNVQCVPLPYFKTIYLYTVSAIFLCFILFYFCFALIYEIYFQLSSYFLE